MVHQVTLWQTDGQPAGLVVKLDRPEAVDAFQREHDALAYYREHTAFPVPEPLACFSDGELGVAGLVMQHIAAPNLAAARLSATGQHQLQLQLAEHVAALHRHGGEAFGSPLEPAHRHRRWLDVFGPRLEAQFRAARDQLASRHRAVVEALIRELATHLPEAATPTLIHGDLWATNVLVDDTHPSRPRLAAFIDAQPALADPEYELAYLRLFNTAGSTFFEAYSRWHPLRPDFEHRCRVYWAHTLLLHVHRFGAAYLPMCCDVLDQLRRAS